MKRTRSVVISLLAFAPACSAMIAAPTITVIPTLGGTYSYANAISADGLWVAGNAAALGNEGRAYRWSASGIEQLGSVNGLPMAGASSINADGTVVVGGAGLGAFRWTPSGSVLLGGFGGNSTTATSVSDDGLVVAGFAQLPGGAQRAFRWTSSGMVNLGTLGGSQSYTGGVSGDGSTIVGWSFVPGDTALHATRWSTGGPQDLGTLGFSSFAMATNLDGTVSVGGATISAGGPFRAVRWAGTGLENLGTLGGNASYARDVSGDGSIVVGDARTPADTEHAFIWSTAYGMLDLNTVLPLMGVDLMGWTLKYADGISADGTAIAGRGVFNGQDRGFYISGIPAASTSTFVLLVALQSGRRRR